jgi:hypothetical protein
VETGKMHGLIWFDLVDLLWSQARENPKLEARNPKQIQMGMNEGNGRNRLRRKHAVWSLSHFPDSASDCFGFRISDFGFFGPKSDASMWFNFWSD